MTIETLTLTDQWDKVFPQSEGVHHEKVTFHNRFGITVAADLYRPKNVSGRLPALAVSGPFGAVKEQSSGLYAQTMAERGFLTVAFDPSYTGESGGTPRRVSSPDINTEDFSAAVDYLLQRDDVDPEAVGIIGICGWGGIALNAAALDPRIKATLATTLYVMTRVATKGYFDADDSADKRMAARQAMAAQRTLDYANGTYERAGGVVDPLPADTPRISLARLTPTVQDADAAALPALTVAAAGIVPALLQHWGMPTTAAVGCAGLRPSSPRRGAPARCSGSPAHPRPPR